MDAHRLPLLGSRPPANHPKVLDTSFDFISLFVFRSWIQIGFPHLGHDPRVTTPGLEVLGFTSFHYALASLMDADRVP